MIRRRPAWRKHDAEAEQLAYAVELAIAEFTAGHLSQREFIGKLGAMVLHRLGDSSSDTATSSSSLSWVVSLGGNGLEVEYESRPGYSVQRRTSGRLRA
jgi:hypothetical protein